MLHELSGGLHPYLFHLQHRDRGALLNPPLLVKCQGFAEPCVTRPANFDGFIRLSFQCRVPRKSIRLSEGHRLLANRHCHTIQVHAVRAYHSCHDVCSRTEELDNQVIEPIKTATRDTQ